MLLGRVLSGYRLERLLGEGGMGVVYAGRHVAIGKQVAVKVLRPELSGSQALVARFFDEARVVNAIGHENIVDIVSFDWSESEGRPFAYFVMELLAGEDLRARLRRSGPLSPASALHIVRQVAAALGAAHQRGVVHRDIKPDNVFLTTRAGQQDFVKLLDFGVAKLLGEGGNAHQSRTGMLVGTPAYMAPEQCLEGKHVDARVDIYSLGVVLFEMLVGRLPFVGQSTFDLWRQHISEPPPPPSNLRPELPATLDPLLLCALAKKPEERYQSMAELDAALAGWQQAHAPAQALAPAQEIAPAQPPAPAQTQARVPPSAPTRQPEDGRPSDRQRRWLAWLGGGAALLGLGLLAIVGLLPAQPVPDRIDAGQRASDDAPASWPAPTTPPTDLPTDAPPPASSPDARTATGSEPPLPRLLDSEVAPRVVVPGGTFLRGATDAEARAALAACRRLCPVCPCPPDAFAAETPAREIHLDRFEIDRLEVTSSRYQKCVQERGCTPPAYDHCAIRGQPGWQFVGSAASLPAALRLPDHPVVCVTWPQARAYCEWAGGRLPTEAEWEKAARGVDRRQFPWGDLAPSCELAVFNDHRPAAIGASERRGCGRAASWPAGSRQGGASPYGGLDLAGNVWEWTADWYDGRYYRHSPRSNPRGPERGELRAVRGGAWDTLATDLRVTGRSLLAPDVASVNLGFRCAR